MMARTLAAISIALCAARLTSASASIVALTEEKIQLSNVGKLDYDDLSDDEKLLLFQKYVTDSQRMVRDRDDMLDRSV